MPGRGDRRDGGRREGLDRGPGRPDVPRLFVAVPIPPDVGAQVGRVLAEARAELGDEGRRIRWVQLEGLHVTLRFLGPTPADRVPDVAAALERAVTGEAPFEVRLAGAGAFPAAARPRALWLGIRSGADALGRLAEALDAELRAAGWGVEARPFRPHLTIARTDGARAGSAAAMALEAAASTLDAGFTATAVVLYRSHLGSGPARYEVLREAPLD
ncbi:MAG: RNA 2',3'-cyclic phosphodiesterase [Chloroflexota bacterium]